MDTATDLGTSPNVAGRPFYFSVVVPEGNCRVTVTFGDASAASDNTVKAESRRLMVETHVVTRPGEFATRTFLVNTRTTSLPPPPRKRPRRHLRRAERSRAGLDPLDEKATLEFNGPAPNPVSLVFEIISTPTVFLVVTDGLRPALGGRRELGPDAAALFSPDVAIANHAESGETLKSFLSGLRLAKVLSQLKAGDDLHPVRPQRPENAVAADLRRGPHHVQAYLRVFIAEARLRGATPVLVTSPQRRNFDDGGQIRNTHGDYPAAVRQVAAEEHVALVDLDGMSVAFYEVLGPSQCPLAFSNGGKDPTHHNNYGAYELAKCVVQGIRNAACPWRILTADFTGFDPAHPDDPATFHLPASPRRSFLAPRGS